MSDYADLKRLAEAQPVKEWRRDVGRQPYMKGPELMFGVDGPEGVSDYEDWGFTRAAASFIAAANPATVLALLDDLEAANARLRTVATCCATAEQARDQLKAENERLRTGVTGDFDLDAWLDWTREASKLRADLERQTELRRREWNRAEGLKAENEALRNQLREAADEIESWGSYASSYFQEKHDLIGCVARFRALAGEGKANG